MKIKELLFEGDNQTGSNDIEPVKNKQRDSKGTPEIQSDQEKLSQENGNYTVNPKVKSFQQKLIKLGYNLGPPGADGKYGPYTAKAVASFKKDYKLGGSGSVVGHKTISHISKVFNGTVERVKQPSGQTESGDVDLPASELIDKAKKVAETFLGSEISDSEWSKLVRATLAEASPNSQERAGVMAVILNRVRSSKYPGSISLVLDQKNQFQAVTGTKANNRQPSKHYTRTPGSKTLESLANAIITYLPRSNNTWLNFTSAVAGAYGAGTNIGFMRKVANSNGSRKIGKTWFGTV